MKRNQSIGMKKEQINNNRRNNSNENDYKASNACNLPKVSSLNDINQAQFQSENEIQRSNVLNMPQLSQLTQLTHQNKKNNDSDNIINNGNNNKKKCRKKRKLESNNSPMELDLPFFGDSANDSDLGQDNDIAHLISYVSSCAFVFCLFLLYVSTQF